MRLLVAEFEEGADADAGWEGGEGGGVGERGLGVGVSVFVVIGVRGSRLGCEACVGHAG